MVREYDLLLAALRGKEREQATSLLPERTPSCPEPTEWLRMVLGQAEEERARTLRAHLHTGCAFCNDRFATYQSAVRAAAREEDRPLGGSVLEALSDSMRGKAPQPPEPVALPAPARPSPSRRPRRRWPIGLALVAVVLIALLGALLDRQAVPAVQRERSEKAMSADRPFRFTGDERLHPRLPWPKGRAEAGPFAWVLGPPGIAESVVKEKALAVEHAKTGFLALPAHRWRQWRLTAEVKFEPTNDHARAGLFFGLRTAPARGKATVAGFATFTFALEDEPMKPASDEPPPLVPKKVVRVEGACVLLGLDEKDGAFQAAVGEVVRSPRANWHRLTLEVGPEKAHFRFDRAVILVETKTVAQSWRDLVQGHKEHQPDFRTLSTAFDPTSPVGFYLHRTRVLLRNVQLAPGTPDLDALPPH